MGACEYFSPLGRMVIHSAEGFVTSIAFSDELCNSSSDTVINETVKWLDIYFSGNEPCFLPPVCAVGTEFQKLIWHYLTEIPIGKVVTYGELAIKAAENLGKRKMSAQAVGGAVGKNPICIMIPCHRVVGSDGKMTGYAYGIKRKAALLEHERHMIFKKSNSISD
ncbi:MAG: methylated-DNA--[Oscillospiraceae bacterium]|nr:methylated-DNA--[protein]-cysteine S-methyltransferase [Oscillospiraceae bacterium]